MNNHYPRGRQLRALEKNVLKLRAFEMVLILFYIEDMKECIVSCIRASDKIRAEERLPVGVKNIYKKAWQIAVNDDVITDEEKLEIESYIDYRNIIGHSIYNLTRDVNTTGLLEDLEPPSYNPDAFKRIESLHRKIWDNVGHHYVIVLQQSFSFDSAIRTYREEIERLKKKIQKQFSERQIEINEANEEIKRVSNLEWEKLDPTHPKHKTSSGCLSKSGIECCYSLFQLGLGELSIAHLMMLSLATVKRRRMKWIKLNHQGGPLYSK